jgi:NADPH2:quinone reductase
MKAIVAHRFGPPEDLVLQDWPLRAPGPQEVQARVASAGVSFVDGLIAAGKHQYKPDLPFVPGNEFAGRIVAVGEGVTGVAPGDLVCGGNVGGIFAEVINLPAARVQKLPPHVDLDRAAVLRGNFLAAWYSLIDCGRISPGETVLVLGAGGGVGVAACQIAAHLGATVIASASTADKRALALASGASHAIDTKAPDWREQVGTIVGKMGVDIVLDPVGGELTERAFRTLGYRGRHLMVGFASGAIPSLPANLPVVKGASLIGVSATYYDQREPQAVAKARAEILELFAAGVLTPPIGRIYPLEDYAAALSAASAGEIAGRIVLRME